MEVTTSAGRRDGRSRRALALRVLRRAVLRFEFGGWGKGGGRVFLGLNSQAQILRDQDAEGLGFNFRFLPVFACNAQMCNLLISLRTHTDASVGLADFAFRIRA